MSSETIVGAFLGMVSWQNLALHLLVGAYYSIRLGLHELSRARSRESLQLSIL